MLRGSQSHPTRVWKAELGTLLQEWDPFLKGGKKCPFGHLGNSSLSSFCGHPLDSSAPPAELITPRPMAAAPQEGDLTTWLMKSTFTQALNVHTFTHTRTHGPFSTLHSQLLCLVPGQKAQAAEKLEDDWATPSTWREAATDRAGAGHCASRGACNVPTLHTLLSVATSISRHRRASLRLVPTALSTRPDAQQVLDGIYKLAG